MLELVLDTDVLIKLAAYELLLDVVHPGCRVGCPNETGILVAAKFVARARLERKLADSQGPLAHLEAFIDLVEPLEPTEDELRLAAELESVAADHGLALDVGESQLCAIAVSRERPLILTGDKRAIIAIEGLIALGQLTDLSQRLVALEQAMSLLVVRRGAMGVRAKVIAASTIDKAVSICFQFTNPAVPSDFAPTGLESYIENLRDSAPTALLPGLVLDLGLVA